MEKTSTLRRAFIIACPILLVPFLMLTIFGCASNQNITGGIRNTEKTPYQTESYLLSREITSPVGAVILSRENYVEVCWEQWSGQANGGHGGWVRRCNDTDHFKEELVYAGRAGNVIRIAYKEYKGNDSSYIARPAFFQELTYDLGTSDLIVFRDFRVKVIEANNEKITFMVIEDKTSGRNRMK